MADLCTLCDKTFSTSNNLKRHLRNSHNIPLATRTQNSSVPCIICNTSCKRFSNLKNHLKSNHNIVLKIEYFSFQNLPEFFTWKSTLEANENTHFVKTSKGRPVNGSIVQYFYCNRNGYFNPKTDIRKRELKSQGSRKINGYCPSRIRIDIFQDGKVNAELCSTHIGHKCDLAHKPLTVEERQTIASKIANQVPYDTILDEIRSTASNDNLQRIHLVTKQDLHNIGAAFGLNNAVHHSSDAMSVEVENDKLSNTDCVVIYKPQGQHHSLLDENDHNNVSTGCGSVETDTDSHLAIEELDLEEQLINLGKKKTVNVEEYRSTVKQEFASIVDKMNTVEDLQLAKEMLKNLKEKINIRKQKCTISKKLEKNLWRTNKNIDLQRRFFLSKKKETICKKKA